METKHNKNILILSASYGAGHTQAAHALVEHLREDTMRTVEDQIDILSFVSARTARFLRFPYIFLMSHLPRVYGWMYYSIKHPFFLHLLRLSYAPFLWSNKQKIANFLKEQDPTTLICTHFIWSEIFTLLEKSGKKIPPYYICITDYAYHPMWKSKKCTGYFVATEEVKNQMIGSGIAKEKIHITGIPVSKKFQKEQVRKHITVLTGGYGFMNPKKKVLEIQEDFPSTPIHIICGKNKKLYSTLTKEFTEESTIIVHGWIDFIADFVSASHFVVTKTGGLSITECLVSNTPIEPFPPIPGQETENYLFLKRHNLCYNQKKQLEKNPIVIFSVDKLPTLITS